MYIFLISRIPFGIGGLMSFILITRFLTRNPNYARRGTVRFWGHVMHCAIFAFFGSTVDYFFLLGYSFPMPYPYPAFLLVVYLCWVLPGTVQYLFDKYVEKKKATT